MALNQVRARVPATTTNLGSGFDTLGIALTLYNDVTVRRRDVAGIAVVSPLDQAVREGAEKMLGATATLFFERSGVDPFGVEISLWSEIPVARGLGSSVTLRLGLMGALNELSGVPLSKRALLDLVTELEHHPDNAAPALHGGFAVAGVVGDTVRCQAFDVTPRAKFVTLIPDHEVSTEEARRLVPDQYSKSDTVHGLNRVALITAAFASGALEELEGLFDDRIHQPYRARLIPELESVIQAGQDAGAIGGWLSGSGSTIVCLTLSAANRVAQAMHEQLPNSEVKILEAENHGLQIEAERE